MAGNIEQKFDFQLGHLLCDIGNLLLLQVSVYSPEK